MTKVHIGRLSRTITPEDESLIATNMADDEGGPNGISSVAAAQKGVFEMGTVITQPGLKRVDSTELLHLTLHQVDISDLSVICFPFQCH